MFLAHEVMGDTYEILSIKDTGTIEFRGRLYNYYTDMCLAHAC